MKSSGERTIRVVALVGAVSIVAAAIFGLSSFSNAKFAATIASIEKQHGEAPVVVAIEPSRIDVVAKRSSDTRTAALTRAPASRPRS
ncbi:MAG TPA: hypothetical protein VNE58_04465 [Casimicrobiaceae bacterium]|nr:hypothetical protein [Casimicrobiaceae bacterium]